MRRFFFVVLSAVLSLPLATGAAAAHGFGERYDLPVPLWLYLYGAGATVLLSFVVVGWFLRTSSDRGDYPRYNLLANRFIGPWIGHPVLVNLLGAASVALLALVVATAFWGSRAPLLNFSVVFIWVIWWVGFGFVVAFVGNFWAFLNPWAVAFRWAEKLYAVLTSGRRFGLGKSYPTEIGVTSAIVLLFAFSWIENVYVEAITPRHVGAMVIVYTAITWVGMFVYGRHAWLHYGEAFSVLYRFISKFSPSEVRVANGELCRHCSRACGSEDGECVDCYECYQSAGEGRELNLRPPAVGLAVLERVRTSEVVLVVLALSLVTFDGFQETPLWVDILDRVLPPQTFYENSLGMTLGLLAFPFLFVAAFLLISHVISRLVGGEWTTGRVARTFVYSLIPIAIAYNLAHFFSFIVLSGQLIVPLLSNPFGWDWDLFGTVDHRPNISIINARAVWFVGVGAIVVGHIVAVYLSHLIAVRTMRTRARTLRSQYPMLVLMVGYTVVSLWIVAQPITIHP